MKIQIIGGKFTSCKKAKHCFCFQKLLTTPSNVLPLHLKQTFLPIIWIFNQDGGDGIVSRLPFKIFLTLLLNAWCMKNDDVISTKAVYENWWRNFYQSYEIALISTGCIKTKWHFFSSLCRYIAVHNPIDYKQCLNDSNAMKKRVAKYLLPVIFGSILFNIPKFFEATYYLETVQVWWHTFFSLMFHLFLFLHFKKIFHTSKSSRVKTR